jgi:Ni/Co efflux regulator RcnB
MAESNSAAPSLPSSIPDELGSSLQCQDIATLEAIAKYAQALADAQCEAEAIEESNQTEDPDDEQSAEDSDARPEEVPTKATVVTKTINGYDYYYWQWRDGDNIKSKYKAPVNPKRS